MRGTRALKNSRASLVLTKPSVVARGSLAEAPFREPRAKGSFSYWPLSTFMCGESLRKKRAVQENGPVALARTSSREIKMQVRVNSSCPRRKQPKRATERPATIPQQAAVERRLATAIPLECYGERSGGSWPARGAAPDRGVEAVQLGDGAAQPGLQHPGRAHLREAGGVRTPRPGLPVLYSLTSEYGVHGIP